MKITYLLPFGSLLLGYYIAEGRDLAPPPLPQGDRYVSAQLFGIPDIPAHAVIAAVPSRVSILGSRVRTATAQVRRRAVDSITAVKTAPRRLERVIPEVGWHPWSEFAQMDRAATVVAMSMEQTRGMPEGCPIPLNVWEAINEIDEETIEFLRDNTFKTASQIKSVLAGCAFRESSFNVANYHYDNAGGYATGLYSIHSRYRKQDVAWMETQPGGWKCPKNNLAALIRTLKEHERYWPDSKRSLAVKLARFNGGGKPNHNYTRKVLSKAKELQRWF